MGLYKKYELLEVLHDDGVKTFRARENETGRLVEAHLFLGQAGNSAPPVELLDQVRNLPHDSRMHVVEVGEQMGTPYVVTLPLDGFRCFREWLGAKAVAAPKGVPAPLL